MLKKDAFGILKTIKLLKKLYKHILSLSKINMRPLVVQYD